MVQHCFFSQSQRGELSCIPGESCEICNVILLQTFGIVCVHARVPTLVVHVTFVVILAIRQCIEFIFAFSLERPSLFDNTSKTSIAVTMIATIVILVSTHAYTCVVIAISASALIAFQTFPTW
jgi:hypothetical protein